MGRLIDVTDQRFGRLTVISHSPDRTDRKHLKWLCLCDCGNTTKVTSTELRSGNTRSCGCLRRESSTASGRAITVHGHARHGSESSEYQSWRAMNDRCTRPRHRAWDRYGGRGIKVCKRWRGKDGFANFLADMGERPPGKTLDRYPDNDGNYEPGNCRWATPKEQRANQGKSLDFLLMGEAFKRE